MTGAKDSITDVTTSAHSIDVVLPDGSVSTALQHGSLYFGDIIISRVLFIPELRCNLLSFAKLTAALKCLVLLTENICVLQDISTRTVIGAGNQQGGVYWLRSLGAPLSSSLPQHVSAAAVLPSYELWHRRFGHPSSSVLSSIPILALTLSNNNIVPCSTCHRAKQSRSSFPLSSSHASHLFDIIHCDVWGPYNTRSLSGAFLFLTIVDDYSRAVWVYLLVSKSEVAAKMKEFIALVSTQFRRPVRCVRADNGTEFLPLKPYFAEKGIRFETSTVYTPQQNGRVERKHRHILNVARALHFQAHLPI
jgi:hypothetical protein